MPVADARRVGPFTIAHGMGSYKDAHLVHLSPLEPTPVGDGRIDGAQAHAHGRSIQIR